MSLECPTGFHLTRMAVSLSMPTLVQRHAVLTYSVVLQNAVGSISEAADVTRSGAADVIELGPKVAVPVGDNGPIVEREVVALLKGQVQRLRRREPGRGVLGACLRQTSALALDSPSLVKA